MVSIRLVYHLVSVVNANLLFDYSVSFGDQKVSPT